MGLFQFFLYMLPLKEQVGGTRPLESLRIAQQFDEGRASPCGHDVKDFGGCVLDPGASNLYSNVSRICSGIQEVAFLAGAFVENRAEARAISKENGQDQTGKTGATPHIDKARR